ncbi:MAG: creatininase family protein, partial [Thermoplasmata archaeon]
NMLLDEMSSKEFQERVKEDSVVIVPIGAVEEHGPHLPLCTDSIQPEYVASEVAQRMGAFVAPPIRYGNCSTTRNFPGTISVSFDTMRSLAYDVVSELTRNGFKHVVLLSGHAGSLHMAALRLAAKKVVDERDVNVMVVSGYEILYRSDNVEEGDGHSGLMETSRVLAIRPDLVKSERPKGESRIPKYQVLRNPEKYWEGVSGDSANATIEKGREYNDFVIDELCRTIEGMRGSG